MRAIFVAALLLVACNQRDLKGEGEACFASSECGVTLVCDFGAEPHVCAQMGTPGDPVGGPDASNVPGPDADPNAPDAGDVLPMFDAGPMYDAAPPPIDAPMPPI